MTTCSNANPHADRVNIVWVTDISEQWTREGKLYLCAIKNLRSRKIVGYAMRSRMKSPLAVEALEDAMRKRGFPRGVVVHSPGSRLAQVPYRIESLRREGLDGPGRGRGGDNAAVESFFTLAQKNVLDRRFWATRSELSAAITRWIERTYHRKRHQRALGKLTPIEYEIIMEPAASLVA